MKALLGTALAALLLLVAGCQPREAVSEQVACQPDFIPIKDKLSQLVLDLQLAGGALLLQQNGKTLCQEYIGSFDRDTVVPVISAAKWLSAATILALVDERALALDDPVSKYLPYFQGVHGTITLRQLLSHTSGLPDYSRCMFVPQLTLDRCAREIAQATLIAPPGAEFNYAGTAFTVAGRMAEVAGGASWQTLFATRMAEPLGLTATSYGNTANPMLSEGYVVSSLRDYGVFLQMILNGGTHGGRRVLSATAIEEMLKDQTAGAVIHFSPRGPDLRYGLGVWRDRVNEDGALSQASSPGGGGFVPWIDFDRKLIGVFMVYDRIERVWDTVVEVVRGTRDTLDQRPPR